MAKLFTVLYILIAGLTTVWVAGLAGAQTLKSTNYQFVEPSLGGSGLLDTQSANFQAASSSGVLGVGNLASSTFQFNAGRLTTGDPALTFAVNNTNVDFGAFSAGTTAVATSTFEVINYTSYGYIVQILGTEPQNGSHSIDAMTAAEPSQVGIEQFGINLVANTSPVSLGANPDHGQFGFGSATANYGTPNNYRYVSGETIASAPESSGKTIYTISYIVNVSSLTPGGKYVGRQTVVCTGTY